MKFPRRIFDLYYGQPASGKSRAAAQVAIDLYQQNGQRTRVMVADGSTATYDPLIDAGIVELVEFAHREWPQDTVRRLMEGWWPEDPTDPFGPLVAPDKQSTRHSIGLHIIEGVSVLGSYIMGSVKGGLAWQSGQGVKIGQDSPYEIIQAELDDKGKIIPGSGPGTRFGGNPVAHYNVGQGQVTNAVLMSKGLGTYVIWTAHEVASDPEKQQLMKEQIAGPEVVGRALTPIFQRAFGNTLHFQSVGKRVSGGQDEHTGRSANQLSLDYRIWTRDHFSPDQNTVIRYKACIRGVDQDRMEPYYDDIRQFYTDLAEKSAVVPTTNNNTNKE